MNTLDFAIVQAIAYDQTLDFKNFYWRAKRAISFCSLYFKINLKIKYYHYYFKTLKVCLYILSYVNHFLSFSCTFLFEKIQVALRAILLSPKNVGFELRDPNLV